MFVVHGMSANGDLRRSRGAGFRTENQTSDHALAARPLTAKQPRWYAGQSVKKGGWATSPAGLTNSASGCRLYRRFFEFHGSLANREAYS